MIILFQVPLERSKPFLLARSLGASVRTQVTRDTTHLVAARMGTAKVRMLMIIIVIIARAEISLVTIIVIIAVIILVVQVNDARRYGDKVHIVTPDWLWSCSERWERVRIFYL